MPEEPLAEQFADFVVLADGHQRAGSWPLRAFRVAGTDLHVTAPHAEWLEAFTEPFGHLECAVGPAGTVIHLLVRGAPPSRAVPSRWTWRRDHYGDERHDFRYDRSCGVLQAQDRRAGTVFLMMDGFDPLRWRRPEFSRPLLERLLSRRGLVSIHGGTIGEDGHCLLLSAKGGSGKSSLVAGAVASGLSTLGDDFLYLRPPGHGRPEPMLYSMYRTVKLAPSSPAWDADLPWDEVPGTTTDGKHAGRLERIRPDCMAYRQVPLAIVVPSVGTSVQLAQIDERVVLQAILPASVAMSSHRSSAVRLIGGLVRALPCYGLTVSFDPQRELALVTDLLRRLATADDGGRT